MALLGSYGAGSTLGTAAGSVGSGTMAGTGSASLGSNSLFAGLAPAAGALQSGVQNTLGQIGYAGALNYNAGQNYSAGLAAAQPTMDNYTLQGNLDLATLNNNAAQYNNSVGSTQDTYNNAIAANNIQQQGLNVQAGGVARDIDYADNSYNTAMGRIGQQQAYIGQQQGFNDQDLGYTTNYLNTSGTLADQLMGIQNQGANITYGDADRNARYATEASGAGSTAQAYGANLASDKATYQNALAGNQNTNASTHNSLGYQLNEANLSHSEKAADLTDQSNALTNTSQQDLLDLNEKRGQLNDQGKQLFLQAAQNGINANQLTSNLNHTLTQLNLGQQMTAAKVLTDLGSTNNSKRQLAQNIANQAIGAATAVVQAAAPKKKGKTG